MRTQVTRTLELDPSMQVHELGTQVRVTAKKLRAEGVVSPELVSLDGTSLTACEPGAHVDLLIEGLGTRQYSLCGDPADRSSYR